MKIMKNILAFPVAAALLAACNGLVIPPDGTLAPIRLTAEIAQTRAITPTQETVLATGQDIYVWANEEAVPGTSDWTANHYLSAWRLTKGSGSPDEWSGQSSQPYYPSRPLSMVAVHGNMQPAVVEERTPVPATIVHTVKSDQRALADYAASDLLYWHARGVTPTAANPPVAITFAHKLSKIEVELTTDGGSFSEADLRDAVVELCGLQTGVTLTVTDATESNMGTISAASGAAVTIRPYAANGLQREAIVPPQAKPAGMIVVRLNGVSYTFDPALPAASFAANTRYHYTLNLRHTGITLETEITPWDDYTAGGTDPVTIVDNPGVAPRNIKMNPLWYVAEYDMTNAPSATTLTMGLSLSEGYFYTWADAMSTFCTQTSSIKTYYNGYKRIQGYEGTYHLPVYGEYLSILPGDRTNIFGFDSGSGTYKASNITAIFGFDSNTQTAGVADASYWKKISAKEIHAIRFLGTPYCSAWKYELLGGFSSSDKGYLRISATLIDVVQNSSAAASSWYAANWDAVQFGNDPYTMQQRTFYAKGYRNGSSGASANTVVGTNGDYLSATDYNDIGGDQSGSAMALHFVSNSTFVGTDGKTGGFPVRLFRDNPEYDVMKNPLWYVAEYNMTNAQNAATLTMGTADNQGYFYTFADAMSTFGARTSSYNGYKKGGKTISGISGKTWHLPTKAEYWSIVPWGVNMWSSSNYDSDNYYYRGNDYYLSYWGADYTTKTTGVYDHSFWHKVSDTEVHGLRFLGTPYCSAWKYVWTGNTLKIYATMIDPIVDSKYNAQSWYEQHWPSLYFGNDASKGAVLRYFYARGGISSGSGSTANTGANTYGRYWSSTELDNTTGHRFSFANTITYVDSSSGDKTCGFSVRLFLDN